MKTPLFLTGWQAVLHFSVNGYVLRTAALSLVALLRVDGVPVAIGADLEEPMAVANVSPPFVSGFERFARHKEVDVKLSGQLLVRELSCVACHRSEAQAFTPKKAPILDGVGSRLQSDWIEQFLDSPGDSKPGTTMPDMLSSLSQEDRPRAARALAAFLALQQQSFQEPAASGANPVPMEFYNRGDARQGKRLYHTIGCVTCHQPADDYEVPAVQPSTLDQLLDELEPEELEELGLLPAARPVGSVPLPRLKEKYSSESLTYFLLDPLQWRPSGHMPDFGLTPVEAADLAAWMIEATESLTESPKPSARKGTANGVNEPTRDAVVQPFPENEPTEAAESLAQYGEKLFEELNCAACHQLGNHSAPPPSRIQLEDFQLDSFYSVDPIINADASCLASNRRPATSNQNEPPSGTKPPVDMEKRQHPGQPRYTLDEPQLYALSQAVKELQDSPDSSIEPSTADHLQLKLLQHNCYACHQRDQLGGVGRDRQAYLETQPAVDIGDEGRLPPWLTGVGRKLKAQWLSSVLLGQERVRPHMTVRMPRYPKDQAGQLADWLVSVDRRDQEPRQGQQPVVGTPEEIELSQLQEAGRQLMDAGCVQCHGFKGHFLPGVVGVDLARVTRRIEPDWLHSFLLDPGALKPQTRMPTFFPDGQSQHLDILGGNADLQVAAMVAYLADLLTLPLPSKIEEYLSRSFELVPEDRPIVLRTFMPVAGTHAIAVGFPGGVHIAMDSEIVGLAQAWRGRFLDAESTWFDRFARPAEPLGESVIDFPAGIVLATLSDAAAEWPIQSLPENARFDGYRLDNSGVPTFLYQLGPYHIEDRIQPEKFANSQPGQLGLLRQLRITRDSSGQSNRKPADPQSQLWLRPLAGSSLKKLASHNLQNPETADAPQLDQGAATHSSSSPSRAQRDEVTTYENDQGLTVSVSFGDSVSPKDKDLLRDQQGLKEWLIPLELKDNPPWQIELRYKWPAESPSIR